MSEIFSLTALAKCLIESVTVGELGIGDLKSLRGFVVDVPVG